MGASIRVNDDPVAEPFVITAIGPPDVLESALKMRDGVIDVFRPFDEKLAKNMVQVRKKNKLVVPAYSGSTSFKYAEIVDSEKESQ